MTARDDARPAVGLPHRDDLQGLRAIAVLVVALSHAGVTVVRGGIGVDIFFTLSGFLITGLMLSMAGTGRRWGQFLVDFYSRRARRILPAAALTLVATDVAAYILLNASRANQTFHDSVAASLFTANIHFADQANGGLSPIAHFWTLGVEEQFYVVWPVVLCLVLLGIGLTRTPKTVAQRQGVLQVTPGRRRRLLEVICLIALASFAWSIYDTHAHPNSSHYSTFARAWELALGAALAVVATQAPHMPAKVRAMLGWLGLILIGAAGPLFPASMPYPGAPALLPAIGTALVIAAGLGREHSRFAPRSVLSTLPMRFIGDRSYAFYLWHWPFLVIARDVANHKLSVGQNFLLLLGAFLVSIVTYGLFENPIRRMKWSSPARWLILWPASVLTVVLVAGWGISTTTG